MGAISALAVFSAVIGLASPISGQGWCDACSPELVSADALITAVTDTLPGHVYVLNNGEVVTELPTGAMDELFPPVEELSSPSGTMVVNAIVLPSRLIVVDEDDMITAIWSNTTGTEYSFYSLRVREGHEQGPEHPLTQGILGQYNRLLGEVDWSERGQVYYCLY